MTNKQYFAKTFIFVFVFLAFSQIVYNITTARDQFTFAIFIKLSVIALVVATTLGTINYFAKIDFLGRKLKN